MIVVAKERLDELAKSFVNEIQTKCDPDKNDDHGKVSFRTFIFGILLIRLRRVYDSNNLANV